MASMRPTARHVPNVEHAPKFRHAPNVGSATTIRHAPNVFHAPNVRHAPDVRHAGNAPHGAQPPLGAHAFFWCGSLCGGPFWDSIEIAISTSAGCYWLFWFQQEYDRTDECKLVPLMKPKRTCTSTILQACALTSPPPVWKMWWGSGIYF